MNTDTPPGAIAVTIEAHGFKLVLALTTEQVRTLDDDVSPLAKLISGLVRAADKCDERKRAIPTEGFTVAS